VGQQLYYYQLIRLDEAFSNLIFGHIHGIQMKQGSVSIMSATNTSQAQNKV